MISLTIWGWVGALVSTPRNRGCLPLREEVEDSEESVRWEARHRCRDRFEGCEIAESGLIETYG